MIKCALGYRCDWRDDAGSLKVFVSTHTRLTFLLEVFTIVDRKRALSFREVITIIAFPTSGYLAFVSEKVRGRGALSLPRKLSTGSANHPISRTEKQIEAHNRRPTYAEVANSTTFSTHNQFIIIATYVFRFKGPAIWVITPHLWMDSKNFEMKPDLMVKTSATRYLRPAPISELSFFINTWSLKLWNYKLLLLGILAVKNRQS